MSDTAYCPRCQQNVLLTRERIDTCLAVILLIFTAAIGLIIYLAIYYNKPKQHCVHCGTKVTAFQTSTPYTYQSQPQIQNASYAAPINTTEEVTGARPNFCALCGEKLDLGIKFCPTCGSQITDN